jgi:hypothetical protein
VGVADESAAGGVQPRLQPDDGRLRDGGRRGDGRTGRTGVSGLADLISRTRADRLRDGFAASIDYSNAFVDYSGAFVDYIEVFGDCSAASLITAMRSLITAVRQMTTAVRPPIAAVRPPITAMPNVSASWPQSAGAKSRRRENP